MRIPVLAAGFALACLACATAAHVIEEESPQEGQLGGGFENPAAQAADYQLDDETCWEDPRVVSAASAAGASAAHDACMREKGWDAPQP